MPASTSRPWSIALPFVAIALAAAPACGDGASAFSPSCNDAAPVPSTSPLCTAFARDPLFDDYVAADVGWLIGGVTGTGAADLYVAFSNGFEGKVARWNGSAWATETLPEDPLSISPMTTDASGEPWTIIAERGNSRSGAGGPFAVLHRRGGIWTREPGPPSGVLGSIGGTSSGLFVTTADATTGAYGLWGWQDHTWRSSPIMLSAAESLQQ